MLVAAKPIKDLLNKLDTLTSCIKNTNARFNKGSSEIQNYNFTRIFKDELNERKKSFTMRLDLKNFQSTVKA